MINITFTEKEIEGLLKVLKDAAEASNTTHLIGGPEDAPDVLYRKIIKIVNK